MLSDDYDLLISDLTGFMLEVYLPRTVEALGWLGQLGAVSDATGIFFPPSYLMTWGNPEVQASLEKLAAAGREALSWFGVVGQAMSQVMMQGYPYLAGGMAIAPFDFVGDTLRGTREVFMDMFRGPKKVLEA